MGTNQGSSRILATDTITASPYHYHPSHLIQLMSCLLHLPLLLLHLHQDHYLSSDYHTFTDATTTITVTVTTTIAFSFIVVIAWVIADESSWLTLHLPLPRTGHHLPHHPTSLHQSLGTTATTVIAVASVSLPYWSQCHHLPHRRHQSHAASLVVSFSMRTTYFH